MGKIYPDSKVEIRGLTARYYETLLNMGTLGGYRHFINTAVRDMKINPTDKIIDLGAGSGYNDCFMAKYLTSEGKILGLDIGEDMIARFHKQCRRYPNIEIKNMRIDETLPFEDEFDKVLISFVLHGIPHESRKKVISNALKVLKPEGEFFVLDYGEFSYKKLPFYFRLPFKAIECKYAYDYLERDWEKILLELGFSHTEEINYFKGFVRLLKAIK
jgi:demethylmenaquinone methyltransferase/2-methoxy-6-polyprenyl-1,4-benzoquinol methylase